MTDRHTTNTTPATPLPPEREAEIRAAHPGDWYAGPWYSEYVDGQADEPASYRVFHQESGTTLATLPDWAGPIALFVADAHDAVPVLLDELDRVRAELGSWDEEARERWIQKQLDETGIRAMEFRNGAEMELEPARELVAHWVGAARTMLGDAPNYSETRVSMQVKVAESPETFAFVLQRVAPGALTPHEARRKAEAERDEALARVAELEAARTTAEHGPLWSLLDWSLWGAGMGDTLREPLADTMLAAVPTETVTQAEAVMAEFIERRGIEKTGVTVYQEQRDELERLLARVAELEQQAAEQRAAALTEGADAIDAETRQAKADGVLEPDKYRPCRDASAQLRHMAATPGKPAPTAVDDDGLCQSEYPGDDMHAGQLCELPTGHDGEHRCSAAIAGTSQRRVLTWA